MILPVWAFTPAPCLSRSSAAIRLTWHRQKDEDIILASCLCVSQQLSLLSVSISVSFPLSSSSPPLCHTRLCYILLCLLCCFIPCCCFAAKPYHPVPLHISHLLFTSPSYLFPWFTRDFFFLFWKRDENSLLDLFPLSCSSISHFMWCLCDFLLLSYSFTDFFTVSNLYSIFCIWKLFWELLLQYLYTLHHFYW